MVIPVVALTLWQSLIKQFNNSCHFLESPYFLRLWNWIPHDFTWLKSAVFFVRTDILSTAGLADELQLAEGWHSMPIAQVWLLGFSSGTELPLWQRQTPSDVSIDS